MKKRKHIEPSESMDGACFGLRAKQENMFWCRKVSNRKTKNASAACIERPVRTQLSPLARPR
jgi:hypothetical protein